MQTKNVRIVIPNMSQLDANVSAEKVANSQYKTNRIHTSKYTWITFIPKNLFEQFYRFANLYFLFIQILNWLPGMEVFVREVQLMPLLFVLSVTAIKDLFEDRRRHLSDKRVNNMTTRRFDLKSKRFVRIKWQQVQVGDLIHLGCNEIVPADILLIRSQSAQNDYGTCYVETCNLDGESNLKSRYVVPGIIEPNQSLEEANFEFKIECEQPNLKLHKFNGSIVYDADQRRIAVNKDNLLLRDCSLRNTGFAEGLVIYAGHETKAMLNNKGPRHKRSRLEKMMNRDIIMCVVILIIMCVVGFMGRYFWLDQFTDVVRQKPAYTDYVNPIESLDFIWPLKTFATFLILYQMIIPISLYVCIEMVKLGQVFLINRDEQLIDKATGKRCECRAWNITEDLGQIEYVFCDKTGTLTENIMRFQCCCIHGINYDCDDEQTNATLVINKRLQLKVSNMTNKYKQWSKQSDNHGLNIHFEEEEEQQSIHDFFIALAICNTATSQSLHEDNLNAKGQQVLSNDCSSMTAINFQSCHSSPTPETTKNKHGQAFYESESPDEVALVTAAYHYGYKLLKRARDMISISVAQDVIIKYKLLHTIPFDSDRKRMSVLVQCPFTGQIILYTKGSDLTILNRLSKDGNQQRLAMNQKCLDDYSSKGLRVLCIAKRMITLQQYQQWLEQLNKAESGDEKQIKHLNEQMESDLHLLGTTAIEDRLQERVPQVISSLRSAGIIIWLLTGDKMETAISIAKSCRLFAGDVRLLIISSATVRSKKTARGQLLEHLETVRQQSREDEAESVMANSSLSSERWFNSMIVDNRKSKNILTTIYRFLKRERMAFNCDSTLTNNQSIKWHPNRWGLVIDGPSLNFVLQKENVDYFMQLAQCCRSVLCCRVTPSQKSFVVKCVKNKLNVLTLAVGDGANDVAMIQTAAIGIGVIGLEGSQAAMASDFAIPKFHFLEKLILVHGNLCYNRLALTILYFFYKNTMVVFVLFFYQFLCAFSGTSLLDEVYLMAVNIFYTTLPAIVRGILEKDCASDSVFIQYPHLYERGRRSTVYTGQSFWVTTIDSVYQSGIIFFVTHKMFSTTGIGVYEFGLMTFILIIITNLLQIMLENKYYNQFFLMSLAISLGFLFTSILFLDFNYSDSILFILGGRNYKLFMNIVFEAEFWQAVVAIPILSLMPHCALRTLQNMIKPTFPTIFQ